MMTLSNDLPIDTPSDDRFGIDPFAGALAKSISGMDAPAGTVIAINGEWGSGKSSAINLIQYHLKPQVESKSLAIIPFNPWWFQGGDALTLSFFDQLNGTIGPSLPSKFRKSLASLGQGVSGVGAIAGALANLHAPGFGAIVSGGAGIFGKLTSQKYSVESEHRRISQALKTQSKRFLVIIDDIDRLNPDDALTIFRLVKSVGRLPNVIYLLSFDRMTAERIVAENFPSEGASYLEKIIQGSFDIPLPLIDVLRQEAVNAACKVMGEPSEPQLVRWWNVFADVVAPTIRTPRDVIRLSNQLSTTWPAVAGNVDRADFFAITALQLGQPDLYKRIRENPDKLCDLASRDGADRRNLGQVYDELLGLTSRPEMEARRLRVGLRRLFPRLDSVWGNMFYQGTDRWRRDRLIASKEHFRSYFAFSISEDVLPAERMTALLERADDPAFVREELRRSLSSVRRDGSTQASLMLEELQIYAPDIDIRKVPGLVTAIFSIGDEIDVPADIKRGFGMGNNQLRIHWLLNRLVFDRFDEGQREAIFQAAMPGSTIAWACDFAERCLGYFQPEEKGARDLGDPIVSEPVAEGFRELCLAKLRTAAADGTLALHPKLSSLLFAWRRLDREDATAVRSWTDAQLDDTRFLLEMAEQIPSESWSQGMGLDEMGDRVAKKSVRVDLEQFEKILDGPSFERRVVEAIDGDEVTGEDADKLRHFRDLPRGKHGRD